MIFVCEALSLCPVTSGTLLSAQSSSWDQYPTQATSFAGKPRHHALKGKMFGTLCSLRWKCDSATWDASASVRKKSWDRLLSDIRQPACQDGFLKPGWKQNTLV